MATPEVDAKFYQIHGNKVQNLLAENDKISGSILDSVIEDKPNKEVEQTKQAKVQKQKLVKKEDEEKTKNQRAFDAISIHFNDDADSIEKENWE